MGCPGCELLAQRNITGQNCDASGMRIEQETTHFIYAARNTSLQQLAAIRGAVNGLMAEVLESHLREEFGELAAKDAGIQQAIGLVRSYLK